MVCFHCKRNYLSGNRYFCSELCNRQYRVGFDNRKYETRCWFHHFWEEGRGVRVWFHFPCNQTLGVEFYWWSNHWHAYIEFDPDGHKISVAIRPLAIYLTWEGKGYRFAEERRTGITLYEGSLSWDVWNESGTWTNPHSTDRHGQRLFTFWTRLWMRIRSGNFNIVDFLLGGNRCSEQMLDEQEIEFAFTNEHGKLETYHAKVTMKRHSWKRPLGRKHHQIGGQIDIIGSGTTDGVPNKVAGIYIPGKGTESYNCGPDAIYSMSTPANTVAELVNHLIKNVLETRERY